MLVFLSPYVQAWGFCPVDVLVLLPASPHEASQMRWGIFPGCQGACCTLVSDTSRGDLQRGVGQKHIQGVCIGLNYSTGLYPEVFLILLGLNT